MVDYLYVSFVGDGVKRRPREIIRYHVVLERNMGESTEVNNTKAHISNDEISQ
jgi:hypothetical protein